uniref:LIM zinc-binding domain-containing protein n=1 Tax=Plectus sambesii TaxID=2011161 RepID=A0A914XQM9_9BILA
MMSEDRRRCSQCEESLKEEALVAMQRLWHPEHFLCAECKEPIKEKFQEKGNAPYCVRCFAEKFNPTCEGCGETLTDSCLRAMDKHWHAQCFSCSNCKRPLPDGDYYLVDDLPYDLDCHWEKRLEKRVRDANESQVDHAPL